MNEKSLDNKEEITFRRPKEMKSIGYHERGAGPMKNTAKQKSNRVS
jgi:hypothetical protein